MGIIWVVVSGIFLLIPIFVEPVVEEKPIPYLDEYRPSNEYSIPPEEGPIEVISPEFLIEEI